MLFQIWVIFCFFLCTPPPDGPVRLIREVVLLTDDRNLRVKALTRNVPVRDIPAFLIWAKVGWTADLTYCCTNQSSSTTTVGEEEIVSQREDEYKGERYHTFLSNRQKKEQSDTESHFNKKEMRIFPLKRSVHRQPLTSEGVVTSLADSGGLIKAQKCRTKRKQAGCTCVSERNQRQLFCCLECQLVVFVWSHTQADELIPALPPLSKGLWRGERSSRGRREEVSRSRGPRGPDCIFNALVHDCFKALIIFYSCI